MWQFGWFSKIRSHIKVGVHLLKDWQGKTFTNDAYMKFWQAKLWWIDCSFHRRNSNSQRSIGKTLTYHWSFIKFIKLFHCQTFVLYVTHLLSIWYGQLTFYCQWSTVTLHLNVILFTPIVGSRLYIGYIGN